MTPALSTADLLTDEQVRRFITDGYLQLDCGLPATVHSAIYDKLQWVLHEEGNPGNNILPAVPELQQVIDSPVIRGALTGVLGKNYVLHPHRFVHNIEPAEHTDEVTRIGKGSASFVGWHQDSHSPLSRPRHHYPRYAMILYYPQDTPVEMGPTQIIPGTQYHATISDADKARGTQMPGPAGTCILTHFDIAHGGSLNLSIKTRHMVKLVFARVEEPIEPSWNCNTEDWQTPDHHLAPGEMPAVWSHLWNWLSGRADRQPIVALGASDSPDLRDQVTGVLDQIIAAGDGEYSKLNAAYALAMMVEASAEQLCDQVASRECGGWSEGAVNMEPQTHVLASIGRPAVPALMKLLDSPSEWVQINALFALGEIGPRANDAVPAVIDKLADPSHRVVRTALDAIGQMQAGEKALPEIRRLLTESNPDWQEPLHRQWTGENQVRVNAMMALLRTPNPSDELLSVVAAALNDPCGYVGGFGVEILLRHPTPAGLRAAHAFLQSHRWDNSLNRGIRTY